MDAAGRHGHTIAILVPCHNEAGTIATVVSDFRAAVPAAQIYVYDNNSSDATADAARRAGAIVRSESRQGKGFVVRRMLADIHADYYILVDGDATYDAAAAPAMLDALIGGQLDLVNGRRISSEAAAYRTGHRFGNRIFTLLIERLFGHSFDDVLSGYKVFTRRFAKSFPVFSAGFEIETELAVHALTLGIPIAEIDTVYRMRPPGSSSKLRALPDGWKILHMIRRLFKEERPLWYFGFFSFLLAALAVLLAAPLFVEYARTGLVPRLPTAVLCTGIMLTALLSLACGIVLDSVKRGQREIKRLLYLQQS